MKELPCRRCGDMFAPHQSNIGKGELCDLCIEETEMDIPEEPDMSGADGPNSGER